MEISLELIRQTCGTASTHRVAPISRALAAARSSNAAAAITATGLAAAKLKGRQCDAEFASLSIRVGNALDSTPDRLAAASDSEGTLGGLVALGQRRFLKRLLDQAFDDALRCSSDPLCAEHVPIDPSAELHAAACHACLFASETTCETNNRWLDRAVLADLTGDGLALPL